LDILNTEGTDPTDNAYLGAALDQPVGRTASLTECLAAAVEGIARAALPEVVLHEARRALLDHLAVAIAGGTHPIAQAVSALVTQQMPGKTATVLATGDCSSALGAALANGVAAHVLELDDLHQGGTIHAGVPVIAAALAAAEQADVSCGQLLAAIVAGYDVAIRLACAVNPGHYRFWHPTATCGVFGAATAASIVLGLNASQLVNALGTAGTFASGLWAFLDDGAQSKPLHAGKAAHDGVLAASLA
jgi:2-methylcitrate dehydratase PrpD